MRVAIVAGQLLSMEASRFKRVPAEEARVTSGVFNYPDVALGSVE